MPEDYDVSVSICTYNRCTELRDALESVMCQQASGIRYEVIVVDNNSTDDTKQIVDSFVQSGHNNLRYVFEGRQGLSHARNTAISQARAPLLAFTDDDVRVSPDWVATIKRVFDKHSEVAYIGGKVLPRWPSPPPSWLTREQWSPMALVDHGDAAFYTSLRRHTCLIGANLAIRREVLDRFGGFVPDLQRVRDGIGSMEDHELQLRLWKADQQGLYVPDLVIHSDVSPERLRKNYHRRWHFGHGHFYALARIEEWEHSTVGWLFGVSSHLYKRALYDALGWCACVLRGNLISAFDYETRLRFFAGFLSVHYKEFVETSERSHVAEISRFAWLATRRLFFGSNVRKAPENAQ